MALCNLWSSVSVFLYLIIPFAIAAPLHFNFSTIERKDTDRINVTGDAYISTEGLQVTTDESNKVNGQSKGRATYIEPLHLWDKASGNLTDFYTHFSFVIDASESACPGTGGDGLAFFLAPVGSSIPNNSAGGALGLGPGIGLVPGDDLPYHNPTAKLSGDPFVAVEFDTFSNDWDPPIAHVGIDFKSLISDTTVKWSNNMTEGKENHASISYNSTSKNLSVIFTGYEGNLTQNGRLDYTVDLRKDLPEWVIVGFSAATGSCFEKHNVKSWEFNSTLEMVTNNQGPNYTDPSMVPNIYPENLGGKTIKGGLVIGLVVGLSVLVLVLVLIGKSLWRNKNRKGKIDELSLDMTMDVEFERDCGPKKFSYVELVRATDNFADEKMLGEGGFGGVYLGFLRDSNSYIAVKRVSKDSKQGPREYASEVKIISRLRHRNLVQLLGTMGYMAPECVTTGKASKESDVYSFGIVALEIACGRKPIDVKAQGKRIRMVEWVWDLYGTGNLLEAADPKLCADYNEQEIECLMIVGLWCAHPDYNFRPSIREAIHVLNFDAQLPLLPSELPVLTYYAPPHSLASLVSQSSGVNPVQTSSRSYSSNALNSTSSTDASQSASLLHTG
ncbi:unnamed protein product [Fraxinus pennsylvanica]|uniref:non-specific serine/threonine protein kinase n=1 Tax=Fraxinus pennsylvanica TaxID=56036 RepID=A0AAD1ZHW5_9LAMI|nr:unnamed protein product [Fraxinus pennsylvanica]